MATLAQLKDARNAGLNLAKATQDFAQVDILSVNKDAPAVVAAVKLAADAAVIAATAVGGAAAPLPATQAVVANGATLKVYGGSAVPAPMDAVATVAGGAVTKVTVPGTIGFLQNATAFVVPVTGTYVTKITPTIVNGSITGIVLS